MPSTLVLVQTVTQAHLARERAAPSDRVGGHPGG